MKRLTILVLGFLAVLACQKEPKDGGKSGKLEVTTYECSNITDTSAVCSGIVSANGTVDVTARGFCWAETENPKYSDNVAEAGKGLGEFSATLVGIEPNHTYYVRAFASTSNGIVYGNQVQLVVGVFLPRVKTGSIYDITASSALCTGSLETAAGGSINELGVCWGQSENPTVDGNHVDSGVKSGEFRVTIQGLEAGITYYVRAYATNEIGTAYGEQVSFTAEANAEINVKDKRLQAVLIELFDTDNDGKVRKDEALAAKVLLASEKNIYNIEGLENYPNLTDIHLENNRLEAADFKPFKNLILLDVSNNNKLAQLDISDCSELVYFFAAHTALTSFNFSGLGNLREIHAPEGQAVLTEVRLDGCQNLEYLEIRDTPNSFTSLSFTNLPKLRDLYIGGEAYERVESLSLDLPALENINVNCWRGITSLDLSKCPNLKNFYGCQMYKLGSLDFTPCPDLAYAYIPDATAVTSLTINNHHLKKLDAWNLYELLTCSINADSLQVADLQTATKMQTLSITAPLLKKLSINAAHELESLDLSGIPSLTNLQACQLYRIPSFDSSCCPQLDTLYLPDATRMKTAKVDNPELLRAELFGSPQGLETLELNCPKLIYLRLDADQKLQSLDLSSCVNLTRLEACQLYAVPSIDVSMCRKLYYMYIPDAIAANTITIGDCPELSTILCWNCAMSSLDLSKCAKTILELNAGVDGGGACLNLTEILVRREQTFTVLSKPEAAEFKYVD